MEKEYFLLKDKIKEIESKFVSNGWINIYESSSFDFDDSILLYPCLVTNEYLSNNPDSYNWPMHFGCEGKPTIYGDFTYKTNGDENIEPFIYYRSFPLLETKDEYFDISEEFILYFNLYEITESKQKRKYYFIDEVGTLDEVIIIE